MLFWSRSLCALAFHAQRICTALEKHVKSKWLAARMSPPLRAVYVDARLIAVRRYCADGQGAERNAQIAKRKAQRSSKQSLKQAASEVVSVPPGLQRGAKCQAGR